MDTVTVLGLLAGSLTTLSFAPQAVRAWRTRSTADLSLSMLIVLLAGVLLWLAYGGVVRGGIPPSWRRTQPPQSWSGSPSWSSRADEDLHRYPAKKGGFYSCISTSDWRASGTLP